MCVVHFKHCVQMGEGTQYNKLIFFWKHATSSEKCEFLRGKKEKKRFYPPLELPWGHHRVMLLINNKQNAKSHSDSLIALFGVSLVKTTIATCD